MLIQRNRDTFTGMYDFAVSGGAIGAQDLGIQIPQLSCVCEFAVRVITAPLSAGATTISFDLINNSVSPAVSTVGGLMAATGKASFTINTVLYGIFPGGAGANAVIHVANTFTIGMSIAVAALTAGKIIVFLRALSFDL